MPPELSLLIGSIVGGAGALLSFWTGWRARGDVIRIRGGVIGRPPLIFNEGRTVRGNRRGGPTTPKPEIVPKPQPSRRSSFAELLMPPPRDQDPDWRRSFSHENTNRPSGPPPLQFRRSRPDTNPPPLQP